MLILNRVSLYGAAILFLGSIQIGRGNDIIQKTKIEASPTPSNSELYSELALIQRLHISKSEQFEHHLRTALAKETYRPKTTVIPGKVIASPEGYSQVHVPQLARVILDEKFPIPHTGEMVKYNQVLAVVEPILTSVDLTDKKTELYRVEGEIAILSRDIERLTRLGSYGIKKDLENKRTELERAEKQKEQLLATSLGRELIRAPITGIISDNHLLPGQIIQPNKAAIEIVNPEHFQIEAYTFEYIQADHIQSAWLRSPQNPEKTYTLSLSGVSPSIEEKDQSRHILFSLNEKASDLIIGMGLDVFLATKETVKRIVIPHSALFKNGKEYTVFVLTGPELITAHPVQVGLIFEDQVEIIFGLKKGDKIITSLEALSQVTAQRSPKDNVQ